VSLGKARAEHTRIESGGIFKVVEQIHMLILVVFTQNVNVLKFTELCTERERSQFYCMIKRNSVLTIKMINVGLF
jgi:hypothetical protein